MEPITRRGLFGLIGAAAAGRLVPATSAPLAPPEQTIKLVIDGKEIAREVVKHLPRELHFIGARQ